MNSIFWFLLFGNMMIYFALFLYLFILGCLFIGIDIKTDSNYSEPFVSVIIIAKNEQNNILKCLEAVDNQKYPCQNYEIIFVDDGSTDSTLKLVREASLQVKIKILTCENQLGWKSSKKACMELARQKAKGEFLLFTDADCRPGPKWVKTMVSVFSAQTGLAAGFSPQTSNNSGLWNGFLKIDSIAAAIVSAGSIGWRKGITCTGRNLAVRAAVLEEIGGYSATKDSLSGDDDFILQKIAAHLHWNAAYVFDPKAVVPAIGPPDFQTFILQKQRHLSAAKMYNLKSQLGYMLYHGANFFLWCHFCLNPMGGIFTLLLKFTADGFIIFRFSRLAGEKINNYSFFVWEILFPVYHIISAPAAFWGKVKWR